MSIIETWHFCFDITRVEKVPGDYRPLVWILFGMIFIVGEKSLVVPVRWEKRKPGADSRGGVALRRTGGKSTTRCTDLEMCDRRRTRNSSEAVRKSNYENVEHATQNERGREKNKDREEKRKRKIDRERGGGAKREPSGRSCRRSKIRDSLCRAKSRDRVNHIEMSNLEE